MVPDFETWAAEAGHDLATVDADRRAELQGLWRDAARRVELADLRASRDRHLPPRGAPAPDPRGSADLPVAAMLMTCGVPAATVARHYGERVTDAATGRQFQGFGLHSAIQAVLGAAGRHVPTGGIQDSHIREAFEISRGIQAGGGGASSTYSLPGILGSAANKIALTGFQGTQMTWDKFCRQRPARDFKAMTAYRLTTLGRLEKVAPGGDLRHGSLSESSFSNQVATYGKMLGITRTDLINDDLSAFASVPAALGRLGAVTLERAVYTLLLSNPSSFFSAGNVNLLTGAGSALALAGLDDAVEAFAEMKDDNGDPTLVPPAVLLVPTPLWATGRSLVNSQAVVATTTANAPLPDGNPWRGFLEVVASPYLGATIGLTGNSDTAWYVCAGPGDYSMMEVAFLNGTSSPTVETADMDFSTLGIQMRVVYDFGVAMLEKKGAVKSAGS